jgi:hypothetical protein
VVQVKRLEEAIIPGFKLTDEERQYLEEPYVLGAHRPSRRVLRQSQVLPNANQGSPVTSDRI